jgi:hypothetical protein
MSEKQGSALVRFFCAWVAMILPKTKKHEKTRKNDVANPIATPQSFEVYHGPKIPRSVGIPTPVGLLRTPGDTSRPHTRTVKTIKAQSPVCSEHVGLGRGPKRMLRCKTPTLDGM